MEAIQRCYKKWRDRWGHCIETKGHYFESDPFKELCKFEMEFLIDFVWVFIEHATVSLDIYSVYSLLITVPRTFRRTRVWRKNLPFADVDEGNTVEIKIPPTHRAVLDGVGRP